MIAVWTLFQLGPPRQSLRGATYELYTHTYTLGSGACGSIDPSRVVFISRISGGGWFHSLVSVMALSVWH